MQPLTVYNVYSYRDGFLTERLLMTNYSGHLRYLALASIWQFSYSFLGCIREHKYLKPKLEAVILDYIFLQSNIRLEH